MTPGGTFIAYFTGANRSAANAVLLVSAMTRSTPEHCYEYIRALRPIVFVEEINLTHVTRVQKVYANRYHALGFMDLCKLEGEKVFLTNNDEVWVANLGMLMLLLGTRLGLGLGIDPVPSCS
jgi:hypothetical protein